MISPRVSSVPHIGEDAFALSEEYFGQPLPWVLDDTHIDGVIGDQCDSELAGSPPRLITSYDLRYRLGELSGLYGRSAGCDRDECDHHRAKAQYRIRGAGAGEQWDRRW